MALFLQAQKANPRAGKTTSAGTRTRTKLLLESPGPCSGSSPLGSEEEEDPSDMTMLVSGVVVEEGGRPGRGRPKGGEEEEDEEEDGLVVSVESSWNVRS